MQHFKTLAAILVCTGIGGLILPAVSTIPTMEGVDAAAEATNSVIIIGGLMFLALPLLLLVAAIFKK